MVVVAGRTWGSVADSVCSVGAVAFKQKVISMNCSSVDIYRESVEPKQLFPKKSTPPTHYCCTLCRIKQLILIHVH